MKNWVLAILVCLPTSLLAAESAVLKEIMGESVYEQSGIGELSAEQLQVLEKWILRNAVEERVIAKPVAPQTSEAEVRAAVAEASEKPVSRPDEVAVPESTAAPVAKNESADQGKRYVRLASPEAQTEAVDEEEPVTQKYVRVEALEESQRELVQPDLIRSRIDGTFRGWKDNKTRFRLENGEIWEQRQSSTYRTNLESPEVIIRKNRFGYTMEVPAVGRKVHVRRIR